ncbi:DinB family protein [Paenibacillus sp. M1]|uniref:DinB family protein n=1 Tax=Paenibacillus haidiansis TaxID=1574488 RepID=A0ABU7VXR5_9BACL
MIDVVPEGFNNSIRWNLGHILVAWDYGIFPKINEPLKAPKLWPRNDPYRSGQTDPVRNKLGGVDTLWRTRIGRTADRIVFSISTE